METFAPIDENELDGTLHDRPHIEIMFDALDESISGNEELTQTKQYAFGVLTANGLVNREEQRAGNESFFQSIGNGAKAVYDYIVKMFKSLWDFFFKRDAKEQAEKAEAEVKEKQEELAEVASGGSTPAKTDEVYERLVKKVKDNAGGEDTTAIRELLVHVAGGTTAEKKAAVQEAVRELPKVNHKAQKKLKAVVDGITTRTTNHVKFLEEGKGSTEKNKYLKSIFAQGADSLLTSAKKILEDLKGLEELKDINQGKTLGNEIIQQLKAQKDAASNMTKLKSEIQTKIDKAKKTAESSNATQEEKDNLAELRGVMVFCTGVARNMKSAINDLNEFQSAINKVFGL